MLKFGNYVSVLMFQQTEKKKKEKSNSGINNIMEKLKSVTLSMAVFFFCKITQTRRNTLEIPTFALIECNILIILQAAVEKDIYIR